MIFASVGTQLPFPRLIDALNTLAPDLGEPVIAQTGASEGDWPALDVRPTLTPADFEQIFTAARVVVAHAGIGTILSAKRYGKPLIVLPRRHALGEHRNDHQLATARQAETLRGIHVAWQAEDLPALLARPDLDPASDQPSPSHGALIAHLKDFIDR
ncbi:MAG: glycosyltransferase family 28 protein [Rhodobacteraceae bacterium]|nr:glycosyltransferase family 28 protein [Paracoccaceae bacterium]